jgi:hypothetical protein
MKGKMFGSIVEPYPPDEVIVEKNRVICIWRECPNIFGRHSEWKEIIEKDENGNVHHYAQGEGGSEHYLLAYVAEEIAKEKGVI